MQSTINEGTPFSQVPRYLETSDSSAAWLRAKSVRVSGNDAPLASEWAAHREKACRYAAAQSAVREADGGLATGLVSSKTKRPPLGDPALVPIDTEALRLSCLRKTTLTAARLIQDEVSQGGKRTRAAFVTLTYRKAEDWKPSHIREFMNTLRKWLKRRSAAARYVWVAELQDRGAVHYHVLVWLPKGLTLPKPDKQGWWKHGLTNIQLARKPVGYMAKYASKCSQKGGVFPKGCRLHGNGGVGAGRDELRWWKCPKWVRERFPLAEQHCPRRCIGGGWISQVTGEFAPSDYVVQFIHGKVVVLRRVPFEDRPILERVDWRGLGFLQEFDDLTRRFAVLATLPLEGSCA